MDHFSSIVNIDHADKHKRFKQERALLWFEGQSEREAKEKQCRNI